MYETYLNISTISLLLALLSIFVIFITMTNDYFKTTIFLLILAVVFFISGIGFKGMTDDIKSNAIPNLQLLTKTNKAVKLTHGVMFDYKEYDQDGYIVKYKVIDDMLIWDD